MRRGHALVSSGLLSLLLVFLFAQAGSAYHHQPKVSVTVTASHAVVKCGTSVLLTATVLKVTTNDPVKDETVRWEIKSSPSSHDRLSDYTTQTNRKGQTSVTLKLDDKAGVRVIKATAEGISGYVTITCKEDEHHGHKPPWWCGWAATHSSRSRDHSFWVAYTNDLRH